MPVDSNIALQLRPPADPLETAGRALSLKSLLGQQQMQAMQLQQAQRDQQETQALNDAYRGNLGAGGQVNREGLLSTLAQQGLGSRIPAIQKQFADADKSALDVKNTQSQISERDFKAAKERLGVLQGAVASLANKPNLTHDDIIGTTASLVQQGVIPADQGAAFVRSLPGDPARLRDAVFTVGLQAADANKRLEMLTPKLEKVDNGGQITFVDTNAYTNPQGPAAVKKVATPGDLLQAQTTMRGQNMVDARAREANALAVSKPFEVTGPDGNPMLVQQDKQGNIRAVDGFGPKSGASKPLTDAQAKALLFGSRAQESDKILNGIGDNYSPGKISAKQAVGNVPLIGGVLEAGANAALSDTNQQAEQAQRDFINAVLRRESGAVIADSEFKNAAKQYFPQPGDSDAVKLQKAKNRQIAIQGMLAEVPAGQRTQLSTPAAPATSGLPPDLEAIYRKHGGK